VNIHCRSARAQSAGALVAVALLLAAAPVLWSDFSPPAGTGAFYDLASPEFLMTGPTVASGMSPYSDAVNPAASGEVQRTTLDLSYLGLAGFGSQPGYGSAVNLGLAVPTPAGVISGSARLVSVPATFTSLAFGTVGAVGLSFAKELYPRFSVGVGLSFLVGGSGGNPADWGLDLDLGVVHHPGDLSIFKDFSWGVALRDFGKGYSPDPAGTSFPAPFTLAAGLSFSLVRTTWVNWGFTADLSFPSFQNVRLDGSTRLGIHDTVFLSFAGHFDLHEVVGTWGDAASPRTPPIAFGVDVKLRTDSRKTVKLLKATERGWNRSEIDVDAGAAALQAGIWGIGLGVNVKLGEIDRTGPAVAVTAPETTYLSPGIPGASDQMVIPVSIADSRYVTQYEVVVSNDQGKAVRTIEGREQRSDKLLDRLAYVQKQIPLPESVTWDGKDDAGAVVPDGAYGVRLRAADDNGNVSETAPVKVVVDDTPPSAQLSAEYLVFSPNGDGSKDLLFIAQSGSVEDLWKGVITDSSGAVVREWSYASAAPAATSWDGLTKDGVLAADGTYVYRLSSTDRAGNATAVELAGIEISTRPTPVGLSVDKAFFSPNGDGANDTVTISLDVPVAAGMEKWSLVVRDSSRRAVRTYGGAQPIAASVDFDGKDDSGRTLPEGDYAAELSILYRNGNNPGATSSTFTVDLTPPQVTVKADYDLFSPNGDGKRDEVTIFQESSDEVLWTGEVTDASRQVVYSVSWRGRVDSRLTWNGRGPEGQLLPDGRYQYVVSSTDKAGNRGQSEVIGLTLDTEKTQVFLSTDLSTFSPNADRVKDRIRIIPQLRVTEGVRDYSLKISDAAGTVVRAYSGRATAPEPVSWDGLTDDGRRVPDGSYRADFRIAYLKGDELTAGVGPFVVDTVPPSVEVAVADLLFSPDGDGRKDTLVVMQSSSEEDLWEAEIRDSSGRAVRSIYWKGKAAGTNWDGRDDVGNRVPDGRYTYRIGATDKGGNEVLKEIPGIEIDTRPTPVYVSVQLPAFSPNGDGVKDEQAAKLILGLKEGIKAWKLEFRHAQSGLQRTYSSAEAIPAQIVWNGRRDNGSQAPEGSYQAVLEVEYLKGNLPSASTTPFLLDVSAPKVAHTLSPAEFSPDEDGVNDSLSVVTVVDDISPIDRWSMRIIDPQAAVFATWSGSGTPTGRLSWNGLSAEGKRAQNAQTFRLQAALEDAAGNTVSTQVAFTVTVRVPFVQLTPPSGRILVSPDGDGSRDSVAIRQQSSSEPAWTGEIRDASGRVVRSYAWSGTLADFAWDGKDAGGQVVPDGVYAYVVRAPKRADVAPEARVGDIRVDSRRTLVALSVSASRFSPNGDGKSDSVDIGMVPSVADGVSTWKLEIRGDSGAAQKTFSGTGALPSTLRWDGKSEGGQTAPDGSYRAALSMEYEKGNRPSEVSSAFVLDVTPPSVELALSPKPFSPDDDGADDVLTLRPRAEDPGSVTSWSLKILDPAEHVFVEYGGAGAPPASISWNGLSPQRELVQAATDYPVVLTATDGVGNVATLRDIIPVDVLVIREGDRLKIRISSITFPPNLSDLKKVDDKEKSDRNTKTLKRIAEILNKFASYKIRIEGHANSVYYYDAARAAKEQTDELLPLSKARADEVKMVLVANGVREDRMTTVGLGGSEPVIPFADQDNNWKNRRVEFVLTERQ
jgi:flagellar hook assembly protein FlgD/outer membrane protein OmpA-like peptidoglycan-associated protein